MASRINVEVGFSVDKSGLSQMQSLFQQIANKAKEPGQQLNQGLQQAATTANTLDSILAKTFNTDLGTLNVTKFNQELSKSGLTLKQVQADLSKAGSQGSVAYNRLAQSILGTNVQLKESNKLLDSMATTMANTVKWGITSSIFNTITRSISKAVTYAKQLDTSLNDIRIVTDKSASSMADFAEQANAAAKEMGASTLDYTNAALIYYQQGLSDEETKARAETTVKAANVTGQTGQEVSEQLTAVWNGYKVTAEETELYVDKLAAVAATTAADLEELSVGMSKVAAAANAMGVDFDDLNAQIATIVSVTRQAPESVGTALKTIYARLGDLKVDGVDEFGVKLGEVSAQMETMGIQILDQNGDLRDMSSVMAEVAEKWNTWTRAQQQAAAIAMAGKRQYNNLVALFENWDMYSEALETSTEAMGTLQHQQDIYMESTAGKLKVLKATWQDVYGDLINKDELDTGIEGLTNLVQVFDNFIESFGGGIKSITAFGAIVANIFNKQIVNAINDASHRQQIFKQNLELTQATNQIRQQGAVDAGNNDRAAAIAENTRIQIEYSKRIYDARVGLNQEQANTLINYQKELGALQEEITYTENLVTSTELKHLTDIEISDLLTAEEEKLQEINAEYGEIEISARNAVDTAEMALNNVKQQVSSNEKLADIKKKISLESKTLSSTEQAQIKSILSEVKNTGDLVNKREEILLIFNKNVNAQKKNLNSIKEEEAAVDRVKEARERIANLTQQKNNIKQQADGMLDFANKAQFTAQSIMGITSALGTMAMAWSSVKSLMQTWNDDSASFGDKVTQTFMTLGMTIPMVISSFNKLKESLNITSSVFDVLNAKEEASALISAKNAAAKEAEIAMSKVSCATDEEEIALLLSKISTEEMEAIATGKVTAAEVLNNKANEEGIFLDGNQVKAGVAKIAMTNAETAAIEGETVAQNALNASMLACPAFWLVAALAAVVAVTAAVISYQEEQLKKQIEINDQIIETVNKEQEQVEANKKLCDSYDDLYRQYKDNKISKDKLYDVTDQLCEKYHLEGGYIAKLTGNYEDFTKALKEARKEELAAVKTKTQTKLKTAKDNLFKKGQETGQGDSNEYVAEDGSTYTGYEVDLSGFWDKRGAASEEDKKLLKYFEKNISTSRSGGSTGIQGLSSWYLGTVVDANDPDAIIQQYDEIAKAIEEIDTDIAQGILDSSVRESNYYINALEYITSMKDAINDAKEAQQQLEDYSVQEIFLNSELSEVSTLEEYSSEIEKVRDKLNDLFKGDTEKVEQLISAYLHSLNNEFLEIEDDIDILGRQLKFSEEDIQKMHNFSGEEKKLLFSGKIDFNGIETYDQLKKALISAKNQLSEEDLTVVVSLREKISSDKKLTKSQIKEAAGEQSTLAEEYEVELSDFDNQSQLEQLDTLNQIVNEKIALNNRYIENARETAAEEAELVQKRLETLQNERDILKSKENGAGFGHNTWSEEEAARLKELEKILPELQLQYEELEDIAENGLGIEEIGELSYDNLIAGIDGVITEAEVLNDLVSDIGENWTIATDKLERFGKNFPEIVADAENYKFLQDGSIQLTEQGRQALEDTLNIRKQNIQASADEYKLELQKQADIQAATAEYYEEQARLLQEYLTTDADAKDTQAKLEENLNNYKNKLMELTGKNDEELNRTIQENLGNTNVNARMNTEDIYDYWCSVGEAAALAGQAYDSKSFNPPGFKGGGGSATINVKTFEAVSKEDAGFALERLSSEDIQSLIDASSEKAQRARNKESTLRSKMLGLGGDVGALTESIDNAISGKGNGKSKGGGGGKDKKDKDEKKLEDEFDRYWELNKAIDSVDRSLKRLEKDKKNLYGYQLIDALKYENELLEKQKGYYEQMLAAQEQEAAELRAQLGTMGVVFDAGGAIVNYAEATAQALAAYNAAIQQYNAGLIDETTLGVAEKAFENFKKLLSRYDTLYYNEMQDTMDKLDDLRRQELENNLKAWEVEVQLKLDLKELKRGWNDFLTEIQKDFQKVYEDLTVEAKRMVDDASTYIGEDGSIATVINAIHDVTHEIDVMRGGGESSMFESISQAQEKLKELNDELQNAARGLHDLWEEAWENYLNGIDQVADKLDDLMDQFERINNELEFQGELIELIYGEEAYELMDNLYKGQEKSINNQIQSLKTQADMWHQLWVESGATMENQENWNEDQRKYYDEWIESQEELNDLVIDYIKLLKDDYINAIKKAIKELDTAMTGSSLEMVKTQWERISDYSDKYFDNVEKAYNIQKLANEMDKSIAEMDTLKDQQKLQALREKEINYLREKEHLTQYDLDAAEARYQIALKEMALEDAQNNKTQMKLVRNEQGNWAYQYMADADDVANKRQELLDAFNELYQLASDAYEANLEAALALQEKYEEQLEEIQILALTNEEEAKQKLLELEAWYEEQRTLLAEENQLYRNDLTTAGAAILLEVYEQEAEAYDAMTQTEKELVDSLVENNIEDYTQLEEAVSGNISNIGTLSKETMEEARRDWGSTAQALVNFWNKDEGGSVRYEIEQAYKKMEEATNHYKTEVDNLAKTVERDFGPEGIKGAIDAAANATDALNAKTQQLVNDGVRYLALLKQAVDQIAAAWLSVQQEIINAIGLLEKYINMIAGYNAAVQDHNAKVAAAQQAAANPTKGAGGTGTQTGPSDEKQYYTVVNKQTGKEMAKFDFTTEGYKKASAAMNSMNYGGANNAGAGNMYEIKDPRSQYATGGYTGVWTNDNGRLAVLHQKELVLNEDDTKNFLEGINIIRDMSNLNSSIGNAIMGSIAGMVASLVAGKANINSSGTINNNETVTEGNVFNITAEFPNANDVNEIREAIMSLPNLASQYVARNIK